MLFSQKIKFLIDIGILQLFGGVLHADMRKLFVKDSIRTNPSIEIFYQNVFKHGMDVTHYEKIKDKDLFNINKSTYEYWKGTKPSSVCTIKSIREFLNKSIEESLKDMRNAERKKTKKS